jgi:signal transduction histidine kinase/DNA-binding NarL/FixJ family response regulator
MEVGTASILIVEDDRSTALLLQHHVRLSSFDVSGIAMSGDEALAACERDRPNVVLMDIALSGDMDGIQAAELIRSRFNIPVIFVTAYADHATLDKAGRSKPYGFLLKPVFREELERQIRLTLAHHAADRRMLERLETVLDDIREEVEHERQKATIAIEAQRRLALELSVAADIHLATEAVLDTVCELADVSLCGLYLVNDTCTALTLAGGRGIAGPFARAVQRFEHDTPQMELVRRGEPVLLTIDESSDTMWAAYRNEGLKRVAMIPVLFHGQPVACLNVASRSVSRFNTAVRASLESIAAMIGGSFSRLQAAADLQREHERNRTLLLALESTTDGVVIFGTEYHIQFANSVFARYFNNGADNGPGACSASFLDALSPEEQDGVRTPLERDGRWTGIIHMGTSPRRVLFTLMVSEILSDNGTRVGYLGVGRDITERVRDQEREQENALFAALGRMTSIIVHDLKTPLTSVKLNFEMLSSEIRGMDRVQKYLGIIERELESLSARIQQSLGRVGGGGLLLRSISLQGLIDDVLCSLRSQIENRAIHLQTSGLDILCDADETKLRTALLNVVSNAIEAVEYGGTVSVEGAPGSSDHEFIVRVKDDGAGIPPGIDVFRPLVTTRDGGNGLGLPIARYILEQHGGRLALEETRRGCTVFALSLRRAHTENFDVR